jgi:hypothetical protein
MRRSRQTGSTYDPAQRRIVAAALALHGAQDAATIISPVGDDLGMIAKFEPLLSAANIRVVRHVQRRYVAPSCAML